MSRNGTLLDVSRPPALADLLQESLLMWALGAYASTRFPRSAWLAHVENVLHIFYPFSSSRDRNLTARTIAPFPLRNRP